jgi:hypothetical protein
MPSYDPSKPAAAVNEDPVIDDEETIEVPLDDDEMEPKKKGRYNIDALNLVTEFKKLSDGEAVLKEISAKVIGDYDAAREACSDRIDRIKEDWRLFSNLLKTTKEYPYPGAPNPHVPITMIQTLRVMTKIQNELFRGWSGNLFGVRPINEDDKVTASILTKHGNWQIRNNMPDFKCQMERMCQRFVLVGDVNIHAYYDTELWVNRHDVMAEDMVYVSYTYTSTMPDYSDCPFIIKVIKLTTHELEAREGKWENLKSILAGEESSWDEDDEHEHVLHQQAREDHGVDLPEDVKTEPPHTLLWYEGWFLLPDQDRQMFCRCIVHYKTTKVLVMNLHEEDDWRDKQRHRYETAEYERYYATKQAYLMAQQTAGLQPMMPGLQGMQQPTPPEPPSWAEATPDEMTGIPDISEPEPPRRVPIRLFTHIKCIEPYAGNIGFSMMSIATAFNRIANTAMAQFTDQASFGNLKAFLAAEDQRLPSQIMMKPGGIVKIPGVTTGKLKDAIVPIDFGPANPQLLEIIDRAQRWTEQATSAPGVIAGEPGKSGEPYRGLALRNEQATQMLSVPADKLRSGFEHVLINNAKLNAKFLPEKQIVLITDGGSGPERIEVTREMYERNYEVELTADSKFTTDAQRIAEADENVQMVMQLIQQFGPLPPLLQLVQKVVVEAFEARGKKELAGFVRSMDILAMMQQSQQQQAAAQQQSQQQAQQKAAAKVPRPPGAPGAPGVAKGGPPPGVSRAPAPPPGVQTGRGAPR